MATSTVRPLFFWGWRSGGMAGLMKIDEQVRAAKFEALLPRLDERGRRLVLPARRSAPTAGSPWPPGMRAVCPGVPGRSSPGSAALAVRP